MSPTLYVTSQLASNHTEQFVDRKELAETAPRTKASNPGEAFQPCAVHVRRNNWDVRPFIGQVPDIFETIRLIPA